MTYHGYTVDPKYVSGRDIHWSEGGNGNTIIGKKNKITYLIKANVNSLLPSKDVSPKSYEYAKAKADFLESKQKKLKELMAPLDVELDGVVKEEEHFWDEDTRLFVTVTRFIDRAIPPSEAAKYSKKVIGEFFLSMASNLAKVHKVGVIHGDIKESNFVYLTEVGSYQTKIIDFDLSYASDSIPPWDRFSYGTDGYESPESAYYVIYGEERSESSKFITTASDIFALGVSFHQLWCGEKPKNTTEEIDLAFGLLGGGSPIFDPSLDMRIGENCKATYLSLINWMCQLDPNSRPSANEVVDVLSDKARIPEQFLIGSDEKPFMDLYEEHQSIACYDVEKLRENGVESLIQVLSGGMRKYAVKIDGRTTTYTIGQLIEKGILEAKGSLICEPFESHNIEWVNGGKVFEKNGIFQVQRLDLGSVQKYLVTADQGFSYSITAEGMVRNGYARKKEKTKIETRFEMWPEDREAYQYASSDYFAFRHVQSVELIDVGGEHFYRFVFGTKDPVDFSLRSAIMSGYIVKK